MVHSTCSQVLQRTREQELSEDFLAIINAFKASNNGLCAAENRRTQKKTKQHKKDEEEGKFDENEDSNYS